MKVRLSAEEQERLTATARALLSPPRAASLDRWRAGVLAHLSDLLGAEFGAFILASPGERPWTLHGLPERFALEYFEAGRQADTTREAVLRAGGGVWNTRRVCETLGLPPDGWFRTDEYRRFYRRYGIGEAMGLIALDRGALAASCRTGGLHAASAVTLTCFSGLCGTDAFGERGLAILRLLQPAFEAGVDACLQNAALRTSIEAAFEASTGGTAVYGAAGRRLFASEMFEHLLRQEPERERLLAALQDAVRGVARLAGDARGTGRGAPEASSLEVQTAGARYRVRLGPLGENAVYTRPPVFVSLERLTRQPPSPGTLHARWKLTPQEARVAELLAAGRSDHHIAAVMDLSLSTVRYCTGVVFLKLRVHSRAEAAAKLLMT